MLGLAEAISYFTSRGGRIGLGPVFHTVADCWRKDMLNDIIYSPGKGKHIN